MLASLLGIGLNSIINTVFSSLTTWVSGGAGAFVLSVGRALSDTTAVTFGAAFDAVFADIREAGLALTLVFLVVASIQCILRQEVATLVRIAALRLPVAVLGATAGVSIVKACLKATDALSATLLGTAASSASAFTFDLANTLVGQGAVTAGFEGFVLACMAACVSFVLWVELAVRSAVVAAATLFLPLALAGVVWPATSHWPRRLAEVLGALVLSKLAMVALLVLAVAMVGSPSGVAGLVEGVALLMLATLMPWALLKVLPAIEQGTIHQLDGVASRGLRALRSPAGAAWDRLAGGEDAGPSLGSPVLSEFEGQQLSGPWFDALVDGFESDIRARRPSETSWGGDGGE